jgi:hypothetical protein
MLSGMPNSLFSIGINQNGQNINSNLQSINFNFNNFMQSQRQTQYTTQNQAQLPIENQIFNNILGNLPQIINMTTRIT